MEFNIIQILSLLKVFINLLLAAFLLSVRSKNYLSNLFLALYLIINAIDSDSTFLGGYIYPNYPALGMFLSSLVFLIMPFLYLYILSTVYSDFRLKWSHLWHALPFLLNFIVFIPRFYTVGFDEQIEYLTTQSVSNRHFEVYYSYITLHIQITAYFLYSFILVNKYRRLLLENYSNASLFNYKWLFQLLAILSFEFVVAALKNLIMFFGTEDAYFYSQVATSFVALTYIIWLVMKTMLHPELFRGIDSKLQLVKSMVKEDAGSEKLDELVDLNKEVNEKVNSLNTYMSEQEPYLDPSLSIYDLSKQLSLSTKELSLLINHDLNQHFFDFVNGFRIRKAMEMLIDQSKKEFTVLEILYDVGFNSKSSFNTAFKKYTQTTPTEYRKKHLK